MRKMTMAAVAAWPVFVFNPTAMPAPPDYLEQERCLAIFNMASAVPESEDPEEMSPVMLMRRTINNAYDQLERMLASRASLTAEQLESGAEVFESEQHRWLDVFGDAPDREAQDLVVKDLLKKVDVCLPIVPK